MNLIKYQPFGGLGSMANRMNRIFNSFEPNYSMVTGDFLPKVDISETDKSLQINAEIPGLTKEDIKITLNNDKVLTLKGSKKRESEEKKDVGGLTYHRIERSCGEFSRSFVLPDYVDDNTINAKFENGVLTITFEKTEPVKPKEIEISVN